MAMMAWGNRHMAAEGIALEPVERDTGRPLEPLLIDRHSALPITHATTALKPGPAATPGMVAWAARMNGQAKEQA